MLSIDRLKLKILLIIAQLVTLEPTVVSRGVEGAWGRAGAEQGGGTGGGAGGGKGAGIIALLYKVKRAGTGSAHFP